MQKVFGILMIFGLLYAGVEYATKGDAAFSGLLGGSDVEGTESEQKFALPGQAAGERLRGESDARFERMERTISE